MTTSLRSWFDNGRPALFQALADVCDQIDINVQAELEEKERTHGGPVLKELEDLRARVSNVDRLEEENRALRLELARLRSEAGTSHVVPAITERHDAANEPLVSPGKETRVLTASQPQNPGRPPLGELSTNTAGTRRRGGKQPSTTAKDDAESFFLKENPDFPKLVAKYTTLLGKFEEAKAALLRNRDVRREWQSYSESLERRIIRLGGKLQSGKQGDEDVLNSNTVTPDTTAKPLRADRPNLDLSFTPLSDALVSIDNSKDGHAIERTSSALPVPLPETDSGSSESPNDRLHSDSTEGDALDQPELPAMRAGAACKSVLVKEEPSSDGPVVVSERRVQKRKLDENGSTQSPARRRIKTEESHSDPLRERDRAASPHESLDLDEVGKKVQTPRKYRHFVPFTTGVDGTWRPQNQTMDASSQELDTLQRPHISEFSRSTPLGPLSVDDSSPVTRTRAPRSKGAYPQKKLDRGVADLAEDGEAQNSGRLRAGEGQPRLSVKAGRLHKLLNSPSSVASSPIAHGSSLARFSPLSTPTATGFPATRQLPFGKEARKKEDKRVDTPTPVRPQLLLTPDSTAGKPPGDALHGARNGAGPKSTDRRDGPLRLLPVSSLRLEDFKVNPKHNDGESFAYSEVVRNKADRSNLPGCVDPACCGPHFAKMALSERQKAGPNFGQRLEDLKLLEEFLGGDSYRLGSMSKQEKEDVWLEAKTREMANKHARHRQRYTRMHSPPGFWNPDMPSTQEIEEEREEAAKMERDIIRDRWREAMRKGGRWMFRDE